MLNALSIKIIKKEMKCIYNKILHEKSKLEKEIEIVKKQLKGLPKEYLVCSKNGNGYKWYQSDGKNYTYIPKKNKSLATKLATKTYLSLRLEDLSNEYEAIEQYLKKHSKEEKSKRLITEKPEIASLLPEGICVLPQKILLWQQEPHGSNDMKGKVHKCISGNVVRSKSEALIDTFLHNYGIPFKYECPLVLDGTIMYPDFTIMHPKTGEIYYWEHLGMMDKQKYSRKIGARLQMYISNGIFPMVNLIITCETEDNPLTPETVDDVIRNYFL